MAQRPPEDGRRFPASRSSVLNCPGCGAKVANGTTICPKCDYIIDASFISADAPESDDDADGAPPPPRKANPAPRPVRTASGRPTGARPTPVRTASGVNRPKSPSSQANRPASPPPAEEAPNIRPMEDIVRNAASRPRTASSTSGARPAARQAGAARAPAPAPRRAPAPAPETELDPSDINYVPSRDSAGTNATGQIVAPEQVIEDFRDFVGVLGRSDKIAFAGAVAILISAFLPWKETAKEGDILGLMSLGLIAVLGAIGILGTMAVRVRRFMPNLNLLIPWMVQLGLSVACMFWCIIFMKISYDATEVPSPMGNATIMNSSPSFGAFLGLLGSIGSLVGTLMGLKEKPAS